MPDAIFDLTSRVLHKAMDCASVQHRVAAQNLASLETPGYRARAVSFEARLRDAVRAEAGGGEGSVERVRPELRATGDPPGPSGNNVSIEAEMLSAGEAIGRYQALTRLLDRRLQMIGTAIGDGRSG